MKGPEMKYQNDLIPTRTSYSLEVYSQARHRGTAILVLGRLRQVYLSEFGATLVHKVSSRTIW